MIERATHDDQGYGAFAPQGLVARILAVTRKANDTWLGRRLSFLLRRIAIGQLGGKPLDVEALGARMRLYPYNNVCEKRILFTPQFFDPDEREELAKRVRPGFVFLDIGANIGGYSMWVASQAGAGARILSIEPQPDIYERLVFNLRLNAFPTVKAVACAIADKDGELTLFVDQDNRGGSSVKIISGAGGTQTFKVPARRLKALLDEEGIDRVDAAKLDTEGAEDLILETFFAEAPDSQWPRLLVMERGAARWHVDMPKMLSEAGYRVVREARNNIIYER
jgi:FkbM family methyltransferase